jgi:hypothetical protein
MNERITSHKCLGCLAYKETAETLENQRVCMLMGEGREDNCPCRICLIKGVCLKTCYERAQYFLSNGEVFR